MQPTLKRSISGLVFLAVFIGALLLSPWTFLCLLAAIVLISTYEYFRLMVSGPRYCKERICIYLTEILVLFGAFSGYALDGNWMPLVVSAIIPVVLAMVFLLFGCSKDYDLDMNLFFPLAYVLPPVCFAIPMCFNVTPGGGYSWLLLLSVFIMEWSNDVFAYVFGMAFGQKPGRKKLFPAISPKKSWAGAIGGTVMCFVAAAVLRFFLAGKVNGMLAIGHWLSLAAIVSVFGILGDLFESLLKRHSQVKDSGNIIPGHGGFLDRFDGMFFILPITFAYLKLIGII